MVKIYLGSRCTTVSNIYVKDDFIQQLVRTHWQTHTQPTDCSTRPLKWWVKCVFLNFRNAFRTRGTVESIRHLSEPLPLDVGAATGRRWSRDRTLRGGGARRQHRHVDGRRPSAGRHAVRHSRPPAGTQVQLSSVLRQRLGTKRTADDWQRNSRQRSVGFVCAYCMSENEQISVTGRIR